MGFPGKLSDIMEAIEFQTDEISSYLNIKTGEVVTVTQEDLLVADKQDDLDKYPDWQKETIKTVQEIFG